MSLVGQQYCDISPVTLQVVGGAVSSSLYCGEVEGLGSGLVESFLVELYRCKLCQFTCSLKASISSHLLLRHRPPTFTYLGGAERGAGVDDGEGAELQQGASPYRLDLNGESKQSDEDEDFLLYNMLDNMSPPTCDISSEGGLQVAHTCEVSTLFEEEEEEEEEEASIFPLKGGSRLSCPIQPPASQEEMAQSAHLMTLGLCRISAAKPPAPPPPPPPPPPTHSSSHSARLSPSCEGRSSVPLQTRGRSLSCHLCLLKLLSRRLLEVHVRSHSTDGGFACVSCGLKSDSWEELEPHWRSQCRGRRGEKGQEREEKKKKKKRKKKKVTSCPICLKVFRSSASRNAHQLTHSGSDARWRCGIGRAGREEAGLTDRSDPVSLQTITEKKKTKREETAFCCSLCDKKFSSKLTLRRHLGVHGGVKPFTCPHCSYSSRLKASLLQHLRTHTGERPYRCAQCAYASIDRSSLLRHSRTHSEERPYRCALCDYSSIQKKSLDLHARRHHTGEVFPCQQCDYRSPDPQLLQRHVWAELLSAGQVEVRAGLSDGSFLLLHRTDEDLAQMMKKLVDSFLEDREMLSSNLLTGLLRVRAADQTSDIRVKTVELNKLLQTIIHLPNKFSQSEAVLAFFVPSDEDQIVRQTKNPNISHEDQEVNQSLLIGDQKVDQSMWNEDQMVDQPVRHEDRDKDQTFSHEDQNVYQTISHEDQTVYQTISHEDQNVYQTFSHEDQNVYQTISHEDQTVYQTISHEDQNVYQTFSHEDQTVYQTISHEDQTVYQTITHEDKKVDQIIRREDQNVNQTINQTTRHEAQTVNQTIRHKDQDLSGFQSLPEALSENWKANGFCLANTETILFDLTPPTNCVTQSEATPEHRSVEQTEEAEFEASGSWPGLIDLLHTWTHETDILE